METIKTIIKLFLSSIPFVATCLIALKFNLKKKHRYKQVFLPIIALIYCIAGVIFLTNITDSILNFIYWITEKLTFLAFLEDVNWAYYSVFIVNSALVAGFIFVKAVLYPILIGVFAIPKVADATTGAFYYVTEEDKKNGNKGGVRYLKEKFRNAKSIMLAMYWAMLAMFVILLVVTYYMTSTDVFSAPFYPSFGIIVLGEIVSFLSGLTYKEKEEIEKVPEKPVEAEIDYDAVAEKYKETFESRLIQSYNEKPVSNVVESVHDLLNQYKNEYEDTLCQDAGLLYTHYSNQIAAGKVLDESYFGQTRNILEGKSVIFSTQFYNDTTDYVFLPVIRNLMQRKRVLVILGHGGNIENIRQWFYKGISSINGFEKIWNVCGIADADEDSSIIVVDAKNIYNQKLLNEKASLLAEVSMVFIIEPNKLLGTLQLGLSCLISYLRKEGNDPQYVIYDRNCDGLVDTLSHVLNKSLVQVNATSIGTANKNMLFWKADGKLLHHNLGLGTSRYLGVGTELALIALKESVPSVIWTSANKFPVIDMRWIVSQYYAPLCKAANLKISQSELAAHLKFIEDPWSIPKIENAVIVAEDEFNNAFEVARQFATRGEQQSLVNVISSHYWLRDYMTDNMDIFKQDPKAIPTITPDYQRTATNVVYKLIIRMIENPVAEKDICDALDILGEDVDNVYMSLRKLILKYFFRVDDEGENEGQFVEKIDNAITVTSQVVLDPKSMRPERKRYYAITNKLFVNEFLAQLKIVYYLAEDESNKDNFLDSAMYGHVYQKYLPGMLISLDGKSYEVVSMTKNNGVLVRRAADHITNRYYYRVLRNYKLEPLTSNNVCSKYSYGDITIEHVESNICVNTIGYLKMTEYSDIKNASKIELSNIEPREYRKKECIRIRIANATPEVRTTVATLLNELFVTIFPDNYHYIVATTKCDAEDKIGGLIPELEGVDDDYIYIIEDSLIDLGLLNNVDRYFVRFMEIICDVLDWHKSKLAEEVVPETGSDIPETPEEEPEEEEEKPKKKKKGLFGFIKGLFKRKKKKSKGNEEEAPEDNVQGEEKAPAEQNRSAPMVHRNQTGRADVLRNQDADEGDVSGDDSESVRISADGKGLEENLPYSKTFFLLYGYEEVPKMLDLDATFDFLCSQGFGNNYLKQTRDNNKHTRMQWYNYHFENGVHYCDFCGAALEGEFDLLDDGRERCLECSNEAITKLSDFKKLYKQTRKHMEKVFGIKIKAKVSIKTCNAQKIAEQLGETFSPSPYFDGRALGFASRRGNSNDIYIENGSPKVETTKTLVHELTHIWQYANLPDLFEGNRDLVPIEGMAVWAEVQYLTSIGLKDRALAYVCNRLAQANEYGIGLKEYLDRFPISDKDTVHSGTPFNCKQNPLS